MLDGGPVVYPAAAAQDQVFRAEPEGYTPLLASKFLVEGELSLLPAEKII